MADENKIQVDGNRNIVIQDVKESTITVNVDGDRQEIRNDLSELKKLLENLQSQTFQQGENSYNIGQIDEVNFGFITGKREFNELLTKKLILAIKPYNDDAESFLDFAGEQSEWGSDEIQQAKWIVVAAYVGVLSVQLNTLLAIGLEAKTGKQQEYIKNTAITANIAIELACFALLSGLWDCKQNYHPLPDETEKQLKQFFDKKMERELPAQFTFLQQLIEIYTNHNIELPVPELEKLTKDKTCSNEIIAACNNLQEIVDKQNYTLVECNEAEIQLTAILTNMNFWANYRMVSIKEINYNETRNSPAKYLHDYTNVGYCFDEDADLESNPRQVNYIETPVTIDAVLLFKDNYKQAINLSPFVIDLNALTLEGDIKICFYYSRHFKNKKLLMYRFLEDYSNEKILFEDTCSKFDNLNELMLDIESRKKYNLDQMYLLFLQARNAILGIDK